MNVAKELATLERVGVKELRAKYAEVFGEATHSGNRAWLIKRIVWRMQALAEGDLSERARRRADELANDADIRMSPPKDKPATREGALDAGADDRLPPPGSVITRNYKGRLLRVTVLADSFEFEGDSYKSLSAVAKAITGQHCNGFLFFRLGKEDQR